MVQEQGWIQVLWSLIQFLEPSWRKRMLNYNYKIRYESEYLFTAPPRALEGARVSEGPWNVNFIHFMVNPPLFRGFFVETNLCIEVLQLIQLIGWYKYYFYNWLRCDLVYFQGYYVGTSQMSHSLERRYLDVICQKILSEFVAFFAVCASFKLVCNPYVLITLFHLWQFVLIDIIIFIPPYSSFVHNTCYHTVLTYEKVLEILNSLDCLVYILGTENIYFFLRAKQDPKERKETMEISDLLDSWALLDCLVHLWVITNFFTCIAYCWMIQHIPSSVKSSCIFNISKTVVVMHM